MNTSKIIRGVVSSGRYTVTAPIVKEDYGLYLKIEGVELPSAYEVDFSNSENNGTSVTMIGNADGVLIPRQFINSGKDVFAFLYHVGEDFGRTVYKFRIPNKVRPDRTDEQPTPEEQSTIDQAISALNTAVEQTAQDKADAGASAQSAKEDADRAEQARDTADGFAQSAEDSAENARLNASQASVSAGASAQSAQSAEQSARTASAKADAITGLTATAQTLPSGSSATASYDAQTGVLNLGIPAGATGAKGDKGDKGDTGAQGVQGEQGIQGAKGDKGDKGDTGATGPQGERGPQGIQGETGPQGDDYVLTEQDKQDIADIAEADLTPTILNAFPTDIASGSIASFTDGADNLPLKSLVVNINPVQDLHGQESPYPAGGGKNLFNGTFLQGYWAYANGTWISVAEWIATEKIPCKPSTYYTASADNRQTRWQGFVYYDNNGDYISTQNFNSKVPIGYTAQTPANAAYLIFNIAGESGTSDPISPSDVTHFQLEEGQTATAYSPYANICPISGWTVANVYHSGADTSDATTYSITFPSEAGTVYGGTLDVTTGMLTVNKVALTFNGSEDWASVTANGHTRQRVNSALIGIKQITGGGQTPNLISDRYPTKTPNATYAGMVGITNQQNSADLYIMDNRYDYVGSASDYKTWLSTNNLKVVYELAEPVTYQLTPTEVATLLGDNTIWADTGDTTAEYRADTKLYIERLTAPDSEDMIADANIVSGQYFMVGNSLYKATANIANGGQITVGTNCTRVSLAQALNEINS